ncbi:LysE family transporter [Streptomyces sp. KL116D]|uniref:LysE family transporter n=2 Tax=Streptomyces sp. KL116D TaxID=3045152 RepID=UPI0035567008
MLPQFIPPGTAHFTMGLLLTAVHVLIGLLWSAVPIGCARVLQGWLRKPQARRLLDRITGTVIGVFGMRLAFSN